MSLKTRLLILLYVCVTAGLSDKTTNINLCCPENQAFIKTECKPFVETEKEWKERIIDMTSDSEDLNSTDFNSPSISDGHYKCPKSGIRFGPLDILIPGITDRR